MNENELVPTPENSPALDASKAETAGEEFRQDLSNTPENAENTPAEVAAPTGGDLASDPPSDLPDPPESERLREELNRLHEEIRSMRETLLCREAEYAEFRSLYPEKPLASLPDAVWEDVGRGIPLSAAVALSERRFALLQKQAEETNRKNSSRDCGAVEGQTSGFLSAREVRSMTPAEVRENYTKIMLSMPKWQ